MTQLFHKPVLPERGGYYRLSDGTRCARHGSRCAASLLLLPALAAGLAGGGLRGTVVGQSHRPHDDRAVREASR